MTLQQHVDMADDQRERCTELMADIGEEHQFLMVQPLNLLLLETLFFKRKRQRAFRYAA